MRGDVTLIRDIYAFTKGLFINYYEATFLIFSLQLCL